MLPVEGLCWLSQVTFPTADVFGMISIDMVELVEGGAWYWCEGGADATRRRLCDSNKVYNRDCSSSTVIFINLVRANMYN